MQNSIGSSVILTLFGESHGHYIGGTIDGLPGGIKIDEEFLKEELNKRRPKVDMDTPRIENDEYEFISGVFNGYTTGAPLTILIKNSNVKSSDYSSELIRPSHADYVAKMKYHDHNDYRGGGHFSGRLTAVIVALGSIAKKALMDKGIIIKSHLLSIGDIEDKKFDNYLEDIALMNSHSNPTILDKDKEIKELLNGLKSEQDSIGGRIETVVLNLPLGIGEPWFPSLEGTIANAMFSIGGIKGIEFGRGFEMAKLKGSDVNDELYFDGENVQAYSNNSGGINGGISNGNPITFTVAVKPTPSIGKSQRSINLDNKENVEINLKGRHDPAIVRRIPIVIENLLSIVLADELTKQFGKDYLL